MKQGVRLPYILVLFFSGLSLISGLDLLRKVDYLGLKEISALIFSFLTFALSLKVFMAFRNELLRTKWISISLVSCVLFVIIFLLASLYHNDLTIRLRTIDHSTSNNISIGFQVMLWYLLLMVSNIIFVFINFINWRVFKK